MAILKYKALIILLLVGLGGSFEVSAKQFRALLFTKTSAWHHSSILDGVTAIRQLAKEHHFAVDWHEDANQFTHKNLAKYDVVIFLSTTGNILNDQQQAVFESFIKQGKGFVGIHAAADTEYNWPWYLALVGRSFAIHPAIQTAKIKVLNPSFPGTEFMPEQFLWTDEYYQFSKEHSDKLQYILAVDGTTYSPKITKEGARSKLADELYPISWYQYYDGGRSFYTGLGHLGSSYQKPEFLSHLFGGIYWAATGKGKVKEK